jgi:signal recognition particle GTPase
MDSMTKDELDSKVSLEGNEKRINRIARGAGVHPEEIKFLIQQHK